MYFVLCRSSLSQCGHWVYPSKGVWWSVRPSPSASHSIAYPLDHSLSTPHCMEDCTVTYPADCPALEMSFLTMIPTMPFDLCMSGLGLSTLTVIAESWCSAAFKYTEA